MPVPRSVLSSAVRGRRARGAVVLFLPLVGDDEHGRGCDHGQHHNARDYRQDQVPVGPGRGRRGRRHLADGRAVRRRWRRTLVGDGTDAPLPGWVWARL